MKTPYWTKVIDRAIAKADAGLPAFTDAQFKRAEDWVTCACGKQDPRIRRRDYSNAPHDGTLFLLGMSFSEAVENNWPIKAEKILAKIEKRAAVLLKEIAIHG